MDNALTGRAAIFVDQKLEYEITNTPGAGWTSFFAPQTFVIILSPFLSPFFVILSKEIKISIQTFLFHQKMTMQLWAFWLKILVESIINSSIMLTWDSTKKVFFALSNVSPPILSFLVGVDENMAQEWKIYSLPMDEEFLGTIKYDASLPLFVEGIVFSLIVCSL